MDIAILKEEQRKRTERLGIYLMVAFSAFFALICTPVYHLMNSNILLMDSVLPTVWDFLMQLVHLLFYWSAFACFLSIGANHGWMGGRRLLICYGLCVVAQYAISLLIGCLMTAEWSDILSDLLYMLLDIGMDLVLMALVVLCFYRLVDKKRNGNAQPVAQGRRLFDFSDRFLLCCFLASVIPGAAQIIGRIRYDLFLGLPEGFIGVLQIILGYASDLFIIFIGYLAIYLTVIRIKLKDEEEQLHANEPLSGSDL